jgi:hypothetical protein
MLKGISIYLGMENTLEENKALMLKARAYGFTKAFLSLHVPEAKEALIQQELGEVTALANKLHMDLLADITATTKVSGGINQVRLDDGFSPQMVADYLKEHPDHKVVLNASTISVDFMEKLSMLQVPADRLEALHNFYPRPHTGMGEEFFVKQNAMLRSYGLKVGAFVPSQTGKRGPVYEGLPTLEADRQGNTDLGARHLAALNVDGIFIGDNNPSEEELAALAAVKPGQVDLTLETKTGAPCLQELVGKTLTVRPDEARDVIRALETRRMAKNWDILPYNAIARPAGAVTLDNNLAGRYKGELEIIKTPLEATKSVNVIGQIPQEELFLLSYLKAGTSFSFKAK